MATGAIHNIDVFEARMSTLPLMLPFEKDGKKYKQPMFGMLEPVKLYRYVFPKEHLDEILKTLDFPENVNYKRFDKQKLFLRKALGLKKTPIPKEDAQPFLIHKMGVALKDIGIKEDVDNMTFPDGTIHEAI